MSCRSSLRGGDKQRSHLIIGDIRQLGTFQMKHLSFASFGYFPAAFVTLNIALASAASTQTSGSCELRPEMIENFDAESFASTKDRACALDRTHPLER